MDIYISIILAIFSFVLIFLLYRLYIGGSGKSLIATPKVDLLKSGVLTVPSSQISRISSSNFTVSIWVNVNTWNTNNPKTIYASTIGGADGSPSSGITYALNNKTGTSYPLNTNQLQVPSTNNVFYALTLDANSPNLYFSVSVNDLNGKSSYFVPILITSNFPLQKWTNVIVSVSQGNVFDFYVDGNLVSSTPINPVSLMNSTSKQISQTNVVVNFPTVNSSIILGGDIPASDISVARLIRYSYSINPRDAKYINEHGSGVSTSLDYGVNLALMKDNNIFSQMKFI